MKPTKDEIEEGNKLIDAFMGNCNTHWGLSYDRDWNWLMTVVEKIESLEYFDYGRVKVRIEKDYCGIEGGVLLMELKLDLNKITVVWLMVYAFIKWYNLEVYKAINSQNLNHERN